MNFLLLRILTLFGRSWLRLHGVQMGEKCWVHGLPVVRLKRGSSVRIGSRVTLSTISRFNPLAPSARCGFVTNTARAKIVIGDGAGISNSTLSCHESISIGENSLIGAECLIMDSDFHTLPLTETGQVHCAPVVIGNNVFVGARSIILKGVTIGDGAVIGAGSVVAKDVPAHTLAAGNPARVVRTYQP